jgi:hypothetical protein
VRKIKSGGSKVGKRYKISQRATASSSGGLLSDLAKARKSPQVATHASLSGKRLGARRGRMVAVSRGVYKSALDRRSNALSDYRPPNPKSYAAKQRKAIRLQNF